MFPVFRNLVKLVRGYQPSANYHVMPQGHAPLQNRILAPLGVSVTPNCGFKVKGKVKRRCKDCYMVMREQRLFVLCRTHPRHKQMSMVKDVKNTWILTHATQSKVRPW